MPEQHTHHCPVCGNCWDCAADDCPDRTDYECDACFAATHELHEAEAPEYISRNFALS
jgi:hypothetical protein